MAQAPPRGKQVSKDQSDSIDEMFAYHSTDGELDLRAFGQLMTEGFAYSFLDGTLTPAMKGDLRVAIAGGELVGLGLPVMQRLYDYADVAGATTVGADELKLMLQTVVYGSRAEKLRFLFHITDLNGSGLVSAAEMEGFLQDFRFRFYKLAQGVAIVRRRFASQGSQAALALGAFIEAAAAEQARSDQIVLDETLGAFTSFQDKDLDVEGGMVAVSMEAFCAARMKLPKLYNRLLHLLTGMLERAHGQVIIGEYFAPATATSPEVEAVTPSKDGKHDHVVAVENYSPYTSPSTFTLDALRSSPTFREALLKVDSAPAPFAASILSPARAGVY